MIVDLLVGLVIGALDALVSVFPTAAEVGFTEPDLSGISTAIGIGLMFDAGLPISESMTLLQLYLTGMIGIFGIALAIRVYKLLPFT